MTDPDQTNQPDSKSQRDTASRLGLMVAQLGGAIVVITGIAYLIGYSYVTSYLFHIEASWVLPLYGSDVIAVTGAPLAIVNVVFVFLTVIYSLNRQLNFRHRTLWVALITIIGFVALGASASNSISSHTQTYFNYLFLFASIMLSIAAGISIMGINDTYHKTRPWLSIFYTMFVFMLYIALITSFPGYMARKQAERDMAGNLSQLPYIMNEGRFERPWRLVTAIGDKYLIVRLSNKADKRVFKVVPIGDAWKIYSLKTTNGN